MGRLASNDSGRRGRADAARGGAVKSSAFVKASARFRSSRAGVVFAASFALLVAAAAWVALAQSGRRGGSQASAQGSATPTPTPTSTPSRGPIAEPPRANEN